MQWLREGKGKEWRERGEGTRGKSREEEGGRKNEFASSSNGATMTWQTRFVELYREGLRL